MGQLKKLHFVPLLTMIAMFFTLLPVGISAAAESDTEAELIVHYFKRGGGYARQIEAVSFDGQVPGKLVSATTDEFGLKMTYQFDNLSSDAYLGFVIKEDSKFNKDKRYVRASGGVAEVWAIDGDARVYEKPILLNPSIVVKKDMKAYVAVEDLKPVLNLTYAYGKNGYLFDGAAKNTVDILTIYHDRDYFEINVNTNRIGSNVTGNMLNEYNDIVFTDVDGYRDNGKYYLSLGYIERLFQVGSLILGDNAYVLEKQYSAYDQISYAKPEDVGFSAEKLDAIDGYINQQVANGFPAVAMIVVKDGKIVKESAYGYSKMYSTKEVNGVLQAAALLPKDEWEQTKVDTLFDLASNSKMYATNYAIQKLVSEGKINLDQKLSAFPGWENFKDDYTVYSGKFVIGGSGGITAKRTGKETVTIKDILHHYGGLIPDPEYPNKLSAGDLWYQSSDITNRAGIIDIICKTPLQYTPRTTFAYSDVDYMILGLLVEQITGMPLDQYVEENIYAELGLSHTLYRPLDKGFVPSDIAATELNGNTRDGNISFGPGVNIRKYTLQGEVHDEKAYYSMGGVSGHAGLFSNVGDMGVLTQLMLNGGIYNGHQIFTKEVADEFVTPYHISPGSVDSSTIGLGWRLHSKSAAAYYYFNWGPSRSTYGHQGWTGTLTIIDPVHNMSIVILANYRHSPVVSPPNGFSAANFPIADFVPISGRVYNALTWDKDQYTPIPAASAELKGPDSVEADKTFELTYGLSNVTDEVTAQDIRITYDADRMEFVSAEPVDPATFTIAGIKQEEGQLRLLGAYLGAEQSGSNGDYIKLTFKAKSGAGFGNVAVSGLTVSNGEGVETNLDGASHRIEIKTVVTIPGDINNDNRVSIGDLAILAKAYGKTIESPDWNKYKDFDFNGDGLIDIVDLSALARLILDWKD